MSKILIADDDTVFLNLLITALEEYSDEFTVLGAEDGKEAIDILEDNNISLVVTDIVMPEVDGLALLAHINEHYPAIPCFVMTAYETPDVINRLPKDILHFIKKPFKANKLGNMISNALEKDAPKGALYGISVASFLKMIEMEKKSCLFEVILPDDGKGLFYFKKGILYNAAYESMKGEDAAIAVISKGKAKFRFKKLPKQEIAKRINSSLSELIESADMVNVMDMDEPDELAEPSQDQTELPGIFLFGDNRGRMTVTKITREGLQLKLNVKQNFTIGDELKLEFNLDDLPKSLIKRVVIVKAVDDVNVKAEFMVKEHYDKLGPYLRFHQEK